MKRKFLLPFLAVVVLFICSFSSSNHDSNSAIQNSNNTNNHHATGVPSLPEFRIMNTSGSVMNLSQLNGKKVFVNLWASWCPPCRKELPSIEKLYRTVDTEKVAFIILSLDHSFETAQRYIKMKKINLPIYYPAENLPDLFNVPGIPVTFIFNEKGVLIQETDGGDQYDTKQYKELMHSEK